MIGRRCVAMSRPLALVAALAVSGAALAADLLGFDARSMNELRERHRGRPFVLALWSASCEPCREELARWGDFARRYPGVPVVLVAADPPDERAAVESILARRDLGRVELRAFADGFVERLRHSIDPTWRGEVPRSYFFDARHRAETKVGPVDPGWLERWLARVAGGR